MCCSIVTQLSSGCYVRFLSSDNEVRSDFLDALGIPVSAQTGVADGAIRGVVRDPNNAVINNADVRARNLDTGFERRTTSNAEGEFELPLLPLGRYEVTVTAPGFASLRRREL